MNTWRAPMCWRLSLLELDSLFTERYNRRAGRFLHRHPDLRETCRKTLLLLELNPHHPSLRLHALKGKLRGLHPVSINISYRIRLELLIKGQRLIPIHISAHDPDYRH